MVMLFIIISVLLIFSLLMNSVEQKSFDNGIMRLVGLTKYDYVAMILTQAFAFVLPSIVLAFVLSIPILWIVVSSVLHLDSGQTSYLPDGRASIQALLVGIFIPILSSIIPIQTALSKPLVASLDVNRSKISGQKITVSSEKSLNTIPYVIFGLISVLYPAFIYYFLPLSLLTVNVTMVLFIFFFILMGMILGLVLLSFNF
jgi:ABC-type antimicrobial peptide transport system permease subunit